MRGVRRHRPHRPLLAVERDRVEGVLRNPERFVEALLELVRLLAERNGVALAVEGVVHVGDPQLREVHVPLNLAQGYRRLGQ